MQFGLGLAFIAIKSAFLGSNLCQPHEIQKSRKYDVITPPYGQGDKFQWGYGKYVPPWTNATGNGDGLVPQYSADLTKISALSGASNITALDVTTVASDTFHMALPKESRLVRQLMTYVTGIDVVNNTTLWTKAMTWFSLGSFYALATCSPVRTLITDPLGRQAGLDPATGAIINNIPGAIVTKDGAEPHLIFVPRLQGQYQVKAAGIDQGSYTIGALEIISGATQFTGKVLTGTTSVGQSRQFGFDSAVFQEENGQVTLEAEHFNWQIDASNRSWISQTVQAGYVGNGYLNAGPDVDQLYTQTFTTTSPQLEYTINFTTTGTYYVWLRGYAPNAAGDSVYVALDDQPAVVLTGLPPHQWAWANRAGSGNRVTFEVTVPGEHTLFLWQREDGLRLDRLVLTRDSNDEPSGGGPTESARTMPE